MSAGLKFHSDQQLLAAIKEGNQSALSVLFDHYAAAMQRVISRIIADEELTEEILHKTFLMIWNNPGNYDASRQNMLVWMLNLARNQAGEAIREKNAGRASEIHGPGNSVYKPEEGKSTPVMNNETGQEALKLIFIKGYSLEKASKYMNLSIAQLQLKLRTELSSFRSTKAK